MPYIAPEVITEAKRMDLLTYLREYEPGELVKFSSNTYTTRTHDSLKISNGKWMWWSRGIGGKSALDYLIKVRGMDFVGAVQTITVSYTHLDVYKRQDERSQSDERNHIHDGGRLQSSEPETAGADGSDSRQMVADEENLSEGTSQNPVLQSSDERDSEQSLGGGSAESQRTGGNLSLIHI